MIYTGTTGSVGGSEIFGGGAFTTSVGIAGVTVGMSVAVTPRTFPGNGIYWEGYVSAAGVVTVKVGSSITSFVAASIYDVQVDDGTSSGGSVTAVTGVTPIASTGGTTPAISVATATTGALGVVKPDGVTIDVAAGVISVPTATIGALGLVQPDGTTITVASGVISAVSSGGSVTAVTGVTPIASTGGTTPAISVATATTGALGVVKPDGVTIDVAAGVISVPTATTGALGVVKPDGVTIDVAAGVISVPAATIGALGLVQPDGTTITVASGVISAVAGGMTRIAQQVLGSAAASVTFSSIPGTFTQLMLMLTSSSSAVALTDEILMQFNGDTAANYAYAQIYNDSLSTSPSGFGAANSSSMDIATISATTSQLKGCSATVLIPGYANTVFSKAASVIDATGNNATNKDVQGHYAGLIWSGTAAINAIKLLLSSGSNFVAGSIFTLYGIA